MSWLLSLLKNFLFDCCLTPCFIILLLLLALLRNNIFLEFLTMSSLQLVAWLYNVDDAYFLLEHAFQASFSFAPLICIPQFDFNLLGHNYVGLSTNSVTHFWNFLGCMIISKN